MKNKKGSGLIFAVILMFVILGMVITLSSITVLETKMSQKTKSSVGAFYNSESGVEWALNQIVNAVGSTPTIADVFPAFASNKVACPSGFGCEIYFLDAEGKVITVSSVLLSEVKAVRSVGTNYVSGTADTTRAIEAAVAASGGGCYVSYKSGCSGDNCCLAGFQNKGSVGNMNLCACNGTGACGAYVSDPGQSCIPSWPSTFIVGEAYVCCQN